MNSGPMNTITQYLNCFNKNKVYISTLDRDELIDAGLSTQQINRVLRDGSQCNVQALSSVIANSLSSDLVLLRHNILNKESVIRNQLAGLIPAVSNIYFGGTVVTGRIKSGQEKLIVLYGETHNDNRLAKELAKSICSFVVYGNMTLLGVEFDQGELQVDLPPLAASNGNYLKFIETMQTMTDYFGLPQALVEALFGRVVDTIGVDDSRVRYEHVTLAAKASLQINESNADRFYSDLEKLTDKRSKLLIDNLLISMNQKHARCASLVTGLCHIPKMKEYLDSLDCSYIIIMPSVWAEADKVQDQEYYNNLWKVAIEYDQNKSDLTAYAQKQYQEMNRKLAGSADNLRRTILGIR